MNHLAVRMMRCAAALLVCAGAGSVQAAAFPYVSCVGNEWKPLEPQKQADGATCVGTGDAQVCRQAVDDAGNATSMVTILRHGHPVLDWRESGDPSYVPRFLAFGSAHGELVVATLQSESQGMGMREWNVAYVRPTDVDAPDAMHVTTAEFGIEGALVRPANSKSGSCALLASEWTSRQTRDGEKLFLSGQLRVLSASGFASPTRVPGEVRFDDRVKKLREQDDPKIPLSLFDSRVDGR